MLLSDIVREIVEKESNYLSIESIISKVNQLRNQLIRNHSTDIITTTVDMESGLAEYPLPCPQGSIKEVVVNGCTYPRSQLGSPAPSRYYYILNGTIGIYPTPINDVPEGIIIFRTKNLINLTTNDLGRDIEFDADYDMLLVWGVLRDINPQQNEYKGRYSELFQEYWAANQTPDVVNRRW